MTGKTPIEIKQRIISLYAQSKSFREIAKVVGVAHSTAHDVIAEARLKIAELEDIRRLHGELRKRNLGFIDVKHLLAVEERLDKLNISFDKIQKSLRDLEELGYGEQTTQAIQCGIELR